MTSPGNQELDWGVATWPLPGKTENGDRVVVACQILGRYIKFQDDALAPIAHGQRSPVQQGGTAS